METVKACFPCIDLVAMQCAQSVTQGIYESRTSLVIVIINIVDHSLEASGLLPGHAFPIQITKTSMLIFSSYSSPN